MKPPYSTIALLLTCFCAFAQSKTNYSLKEAIDYAVANNYTIKNREIDQRIATAQKNEQGAKGLPQINGNVDLIHYQNIQKNITENGTGLSNNPAIPIGTPVAFQLGLPNQFLPSVTGSQVLFDQAYFAGLRGSKTYEELSTKSTTMTKIEVAQAVTKAYYAVLVNDKQLAYIITNLSRLDSTFLQTKALYQNGLVREIDVDRTEVSLNNLKEEKIRITRLLELSKSLLKFQMNLPLRDSIVLTDELTENTLIDLAQTPSQAKMAYSNRIEYSILETQALLNKFDTRSAKGGFFPRLSAIGAAGYNPGASQFSNLTQSNRWYFYSYLGLRLQVPLFNGFATHHRVQQKKLQEEKTANDRKLWEQRIDLEIDQALINLENSMVSLQTQKRNLNLAERTLKVLKAENVEGISTNLDVTVAEADLKAAQTNYYNALYNALVSKADYEKATGNLYK